MFQTESIRATPPVCFGNGAPAGVVPEGEQVPQWQPEMMLGYAAGAWIWWLNSFAVPVVWLTPSAGGCCATNGAVPPVVAYWSRRPLFGLIHGSPVPAQSQFGSKESAPSVQAGPVLVAGPK